MAESGPDLTVVKFVSVKLTKEYSALELLYTVQTTTVMSGRLSMITEQL